MKVIKAQTVEHGASWDETTVTEVELDPVDVEISEMERLRVVAEHAKLAFEQQQVRVIDMLEAREEKTHVSALDGGRQATVVYGETVTYDLEGLVNHLDQRQLEAITTPRVDGKKLEQAVMSGLVPAVLVAEHATVKPRKPFVKMSDHREVDE